MEPFRSDPTLRYYIIVLVAHRTTLESTFLCLIPDVCSWKTVTTLWLLNSKFVARIFAGLTR